MSNNLFSKRVLLGVLTGLAVWVFSLLFFRSNLITGVMGILVAVKIAQVSEPQDVAAVSGMIGAMIGLYVGGMNYYQLGEIKTALEIIGFLGTALFGAIVSGLFWALIGFVTGKVMRKLQESQDFFF